MTLIPGDGIGPEVVASARRVVDAVTREIAWDVVEAGDAAFAKHGTPVPDAVIRSLRETGLGLKGPITVPERGYASPNMEIRRALGLWCNVRFAATMDRSGSRFGGVDIAIARDVTEDLGRGAQQLVGPDAGIAVKFITRAATRRLAEFVFGYAERSGRRRVTVAHQALVHPPTDGLFLETMRDVAQGVRGIALDDEAMDVLAMHLVTRPEAYDVLVAPMSYGGILMGLCAGIAGSVGLMPGFVAGDEGRTIFEAGHGSAPKYRGLNRVDPTAAILCGALLLDHIGQPDAASRVRRAVRAVIAEGTSVTYDLGGGASTTEMTDAVVARLA